MKVFINQTIVKLVSSEVDDRITRVCIDQRKDYGSLSSFRKASRFLLWWGQPFLKVLGPS
jgi:hypothetical protein